MTNVLDTITTAILTPAGLEPAPYHVRSLTEAIAYEPNGVYTVARTFHGDHALLLDAHLDRLEESAVLSGIRLALDRGRLRAALRELLHEAGYPDAKFRITVPQDRPDHLYFALEAFQPVPEAVMRQGAHVITVPLVRQNPVVKTTAWMTDRRPTYEALPSGVYEGILMRDDGTLLEGLSSNFYGIVGGVLYTAGEGVLAGITRKAVLRCVPDSVRIQMTALHQRDVPRLDEAMLTSSGRGIVPVTVIDGQPVGEGCIGPIVANIMRHYDAWTEAHLEPI